MDIAKKESPLTALYDWNCTVALIFRNSFLDTVHNSWLCLNKHVVTSTCKTNAALNTDWLQLFTSFWVHNMSESGQEKAKRIWDLKIIQIICFNPPSLVLRKLIENFSDINKVSNKLGTRIWTPGMNSNSVHFNKKHFHNKEHFLSLFSTCYQLPFGIPFPLYHESMCTSMAHV